MLAAKVYEVLVRGMELQLGTTLGQQHALVEEFQGKLDSKTRLEIPSAYEPSTRQARVIVSTVAFGLGMGVRTLPYSIK